MFSSNKPYFRRKRCQIVYTLRNLMESFIIEICLISMRNRQYSRINCILLRMLSLIRAYLNWTPSIPRHTTKWIDIKYAPCKSLLHIIFCSLAKRFQIFVPHFKWRTVAGVNVMSSMCAKLKLVMWTFHNKRQFACFSYLVLFHTQKSKDLWLMIMKNGAEVFQHFASLLTQTN